MILLKLNTYPFHCSLLSNTPNRMRNICVVNILNFILYSTKNVYYNIFIDRGRGDISEDASFYSLYHH